MLFRSRKGIAASTMVDAAMPFLRSLGIEWAPGITTREPRPSDRPGSMIHVSHEKFLTMVTEGDVMEYATVVGQSYGTPVKVITAGSNGAIKIVTVDGAIAIRDWMIHQSCKRDMGIGWDLLSVYVTVPMRDAHDRLRHRGWTDEMISERDSFNFPGYGHETINPDDVDLWGDRKSVV